MATAFRDCAPRKKVLLAGEMELPREKDEEILRSAQGDRSKKSIARVAVSLGVRISV
jgi:hypothetical protein